MNLANLCEIRMCKGIIWKLFKIILHGAPRFRCFRCFRRYEEIFIVTVRKGSWYIIVNRLCYLILFHSFCSGRLREIKRRSQCSVVAQCIQCFFFFKLQYIYRMYHCICNSTDIIYYLIVITPFRSENNSCKKSMPLPTFKHTSKIFPKYFNSPD